MGLINTSKSKCQEKLPNLNPEPENQLLKKELLEKLNLSLDLDLPNQRKRSSKERPRKLREFLKSPEVDSLKPKYSRVEKSRLSEVSKRKISPETNTVDMSPKKLPPEERRTYGWLPSKKLEDLLKSKVSVLLEVNPELDKLYSLRPAHYTKNDDL